MRNYAASPRRQYGSNAPVTAATVRPGMTILVRYDGSAYCPGRTATLDYAGTPARVQHVAPGAWPGGDRSSVITLDNGVTVTAAAGALVPLG